MPKKIYDKYTMLDIAYRNKNMRVTIDKFMQGRGFRISDKEVLEFVDNADLKNYFKNDKKWEEWKEKVELYKQFLSTRWGIFRREDGKIIFD
ncbi:MAG: hypothetical protein ACYCSB_01330 [bacterium]|jgi:hypothetical protein